MRFTVMLSIVTILKSLQYLEKDVENSLGLGLFMAILLVLDILEVVLKPLNR